MSGTVRSLYVIGNGDAHPYLLERLASAGYSVTWSDAIDSQAARKVSLRACAGIALIPNWDRYRRNRFLVRYAKLHRKPVKTAEQWITEGKR